MGDPLSDVFLTLSDFNQVVPDADSCTHESGERDRPERYTDEVPHWNLNTTSL